jgi:hypothetical protein
MLLLIDVAVLREDTTYMYCIPTTLGSSTKQQEHSGILHSPAMNSLQSGWNLGIYIQLLGCC